MYGGIHIERVKMRSRANCMQAPGERTSSPEMPWLASCSHEVLGRPRFARCFAATLEEVHLVGAAAAKVLLVEESSALGAASADVIGQLGHDVRLSTSADDVFRAFASTEKFDAMIMDIALGGQDSVALVDALCDKGYKLPPIVLFSAQPTDLVLRAAAAISAITILQKPCTSDQIKRALERALHAARSA